MKGTFTDTGGTQYVLAYNIIKGEVGITYAFRNAPLFLEGGVLGEGLHNKSNAPSNGSVFGPFVGVGLKF